MDLLGQINFDLAVPVLNLGRYASLVVFALGLAWASGISLYMVMMVLGLIGVSGLGELPAGLSLFESPILLLLSAIMYVVQLVASRMPEGDTGWDFIHGIIFIVAGALLSAATVSPVGQPDPAAALSVGAVGGWIAYIAHASRLGAVGHSHLYGDAYPRWMLIVGRDATAIAGLWAAFHYPLVFMLLLIVFVLFALLSDHAI